MRAVQAAPRPAWHPVLALCVGIGAAAWAGWPVDGLAQQPKPAAGASARTAASAAAPAASPAASSSGASLPDAPRPASAMAATVSVIAEAMRSAPSVSLVACSAPRSDIPAPRAQDLAARYCNLLAGALGQRAGKSPATIASVRSAALSLRGFIFVDLEIASGELRVQADLYPVPRNVWDRARDPSPAPVQHAFAAARLDAEVRTYLAPVPLVALRAEKASLDEADIVALGCQDTDGDSALELVTVSRRNLSVGRVRGGRFQILRRAAWADLSPISPTPWREPLASVSFPAPSIIDVGLTDRARSLRLDPELKVLAALDGIPLQLPAGAACARNQPGAVFDKLSACRPTDPAPQIKEPGFAFDAWASGRVVGCDGTVRDVWAARDPADAKVLLRDSTGRSASLPRAGAAFAVADLDQDGDPEIVTTRDVLEEKDDAVVVRTWQASGLKDRLTVPVPTGVAAVAACPADGAGLRALVVATRNELWVLR